MSAPTNNLTDAQDAVLATVDERWGVERWTQVESGSLHVELADGDTGAISPDGTNTWGL